MTVTDGKGNLGKIYDRLRKRSYRLLNSRGRQRWNIYVYYEDMHISYVAGVRDALNEINRQEH